MENISFMLIAQQAELIMFCDVLIIRVVWRINMSIVSMSIPDDLVAEMDGIIQGGSYAGRSDFMRAAIRELLHHRHGPDQGHVHGSITLTYPHEHDVNVSNTRHQFHDVVLSLMHTHCEPETCMDVLIVGGDIARVTELQETMSRMREVRRSQLTLMT
jgi:CopG family nickel-responsive transcriptional regulator